MPNLVTGGDGEDHAAPQLFVGISGIEEIVPYLYLAGIQAKHAERCDLS
jgi:hypothetical protein